MNFLRQMPPEEIKRRFWNLVTDKFMPDFDYFRRSFSFKTVWRISPFSYRCCPCAFENEYVDYISDSGEINTEMCNKIVQSIIDKKCPHVDETHNGHLSETSISGVHIAAAVGTVDVFRNNGFQYREWSAGRLGMTPCHIAVMKNKPESLLLLMDIYPYTKEYLYFRLCHRSEEDNNKLNVLHSVSFLELCIRKKNPRLLSSFLKAFSVPMDVAKALAYTFTHGLSELRDILVQNLPELAACPGSDLGHKNIVDCAAVSIIYNEPQVLEEILELLSGLNVLSLGTEDYKTELASIGLRLQRTECQEVLDTFMAFCEDSEPADVTFRGLLTLLVNFLDAENDEIVSILKSIPDVDKIVNCPDEEGRTKLSQYLHDSTPTPDPKIVKLLLDIGADVNGQFPNGESPLKFLLNDRVIQPFLHYQNLRETLEVLLNENIDWDRQAMADKDSDSVIVLALLLEETVPQSDNCMEDSPTDIKLNCSTNTVSGHSEQNGKSALNFLVPLLIECGYPATRDDLLKAVKDNLDPTEFEYIQHVIDTPRSLQLQCRDTLRNHFKGRQIWYFLDTTIVPKAIKDFILLKPVLLLLNKT